MGHQANEEFFFIEESLDIEMILQGAFHVYSTPKLRQGNTCSRRTSLIKQMNCQICRQ